MKIPISDTIIRLAYNFFDVEASAAAGLPHERMIEYSFALSRLLNKNVREKIVKALDVGSVARMNPIPATLSELGYEVVGIDNRDFKYKHRNFTFYKGDIQHTNFELNYFDAICAISTIEHIGLSGRYGINKSNSSGDTKAICEISRILKPEGIFIITLPYGDTKKSNNMGRVYNYGSVVRLLCNFNIEEILFFHKVKDIWEQTIDTYTSEGVVCIKAINT